MNLFSSLGGVEMIIKKETSSNFHVVYATKEEIEASASKILKKYADTFRRLAE